MVTTSKETQESQKGYFSQVKFPAETYGKIVRYQTDQKFLHGRKINIPDAINELVVKGLGTLKKDS